MRFKEGVYTKVTKIVDGVEKNLNLSQDALAAMNMADIISQELTGKELIVTSIFDGKHSRNSLHYNGDAFDFRIWTYTKTQVEEIVRTMKVELSDDFDIVIEIDHVHVEYDPK